MKKLIITLTLLVAFFFAGNSQSPSDSTQIKGKNHRGHNSHGKGDRHHKGIRLFHCHPHHGKDHAQAGTRSHHGRKGQGDKKTNGNKEKQ